MTTESQDHSDSVPPGSAAPLRALLLHRLPDAEREALEARLLAERGLAEAIEDEEYALLDDYAAARLGPEDRAAVEQHLLRTPRDRLRLRVAELLAREAGTRADAGAAQRRRLLALRSRLRIAVALAAGIAIVAVIALRPQPDSGAAPGEAPAPLAEADIVTITLRAGISRGVGAAGPAIPSTARQLRVQAELEASSVDARYRLSLLDRAGRVLAAAEELAPRRAAGRSYVEALLPLAAPAAAVRVRLEQAGATIEEWPLGDGG